MIFNVIFAHYLLQESVDISDITGISLILIGTIMTTIFGNHDVRDVQPIELVKLASRPLFLIYIAGVLFVIVVAYILVQGLEADDVAFLEILAQYSNEKQEEPHEDTQCTNDDEICDIQARDQSTKETLAVPSLDSCTNSPKIDSDRNGMDARICKDYTTQSQTHGIRLSLYIALARALGTKMVSRLEASLVVIPFVYAAISGESFLRSNSFHYWSSLCFCFSPLSLNF